MRRRAIARFVVTAAVTATLAGLAAAGLGVGPAMADPLTTPSLTTLVGVGSETLAPLFDGGTSRQPRGDAPGTFVHDYNATKPRYPVASWDAVNPVTGATNQVITAKALNSKDTTCQVYYRPDGSSAGIFILDQDQGDMHRVGGQVIRCVDYVRSALPPNTTTYMDAFVALMRDALDWSYPTVKGEKNPQPKSLLRAQLVAIYTCRFTNWKQVGGKNAPIGAVIPATGSDTRTSWLLKLGISATTVEPCWQNGAIKVKGATQVIEDDTGVSPGNVAQFTKTQKFPDGKTIPAADDIFPYSIGDWIAQSPVSKGVGGHATSVWGHGNLNLGEIRPAFNTGAPVTKNSKGQPVINPSWNSAFVRTLYVVVRNGCYTSLHPTSTAVCFPTSKPPPLGTTYPYPTYEVKGLPALFGKSGWICTNKTALADIMSYGFGRQSDCGALTAGD
jgi:hypothetical protein